VPLSVIPLTPSGTGATFRLESGGTVITNPKGAGSPQALPWPGAAMGRAAVVVQPDAAPDPVGGLFGSSQPAEPPQPSQLEKVGTWSLMRLAEAGRPLRQGDKVSVSYSVGGRSVSYQFVGVLPMNPLSSAALREFSCPSSL
jgi:type VI secretion system protein ImpL